MAERLEVIFENKREVELAKVILRVLMQREHGKPLPLIDLIKQGGDDLNRVEALHHDSSAVDYDRIFEELHRFSYTMEPSRFSRVITEPGLMMPQSARDFFGSMYKQ